MINRHSLQMFKIFLFLFRAAEELNLLLGKRTVEDDSKSEKKIKKLRSQVEVAESELR